MKIYLLTIAGLKKPEFTGRIDPHNRTDGLALVMPHPALHTPNLILQLPARMAEGVISECQIRVTFILRRSPGNIHFPAIGQGQADGRRINHPCDGAPLAR